MFWQFDKGHAQEDFAARDRPQVWALQRGHLAAEGAATAGVLGGAHLACAQQIRALSHKWQQIANFVVTVFFGGINNCQFVVKMKTKPFLEVPLRARRRVVRIVASALW